MYCYLVRYWMGTEKIHLFFGKLSAWTKVVGLYIILRTKIFDLYTVIFFFC